VVKFATHALADAINNKNGVNHTTLSFNGTLASGQALSLHGDMHFGTNASGQPTAVHGSVTC
jgi:hypothetical protein